MKDNLPMLEVKALGGFSMRYGEKTISIGSGKSTKAVKLLQILVCSEGRTVSRERLLDMLYGNEDITDAANNLRVTTFRLKKMLVTAGLPQYDYIQIKSGMYSFATPMEVVLDADRFVSLCDQADEAENTEEKIDLLKKACQLYGGDYLPDFICDGVVLAKNSNYKEKYTNALNTLCELLMDRGEYETAIEVCEPACRMYPFDEWQAIQIDCLMRMKKYDEALKEYENTAKMFVDELGVYPSERMMKLFEQMNGRMNFKTQSLPEMEKRLKETDKGSGAYFCSLPGFRDTYRLLARIVERNGQSVYLMLCSITNGKGQPMKNEERLDMMGKELQDTLAHCLRRGDSYTRYSKSQYLLLLVGTNRENCSLIFERIQKYFSREHKTWSKYLEYAVSSVADSGFNSEDNENKWKWGKTWDK